MKGKCEDCAPDTQGHGIPCLVFNETNVVGLVRAVLS